MRRHILLILHTLTFALLLFSIYLILLDNQFLSLSCLTPFAPSLFIILRGCFPRFLPSLRYTLRLPQDDSARSTFRGGQIIAEANSMHALRQKCRPKHQVLILKCYPRTTKGAVDVKPNSSELSYLLYYATTRRSKVQKVGAFLEKKTASDVWRARIGYVHMPFANFCNT